MHSRIVNGHKLLCDAQTMLNHIGELQLYFYFTHYRLFPLFICITYPFTGLWKCEKTGDHIWTAPTVWKFIVYPPCNTSVFVPWWYCCLLNLRNCYVFINVKVLIKCMFWIEYIVRTAKKLSLNYMCGSLGKSGQRCKFHILKWILHLTHHFFICITLFNLLC